MPTNGELEKVQSYEEWPAKISINRKMSTINDSVCINCDLLISEGLLTITIYLNVGYVRLYQKVNSSYQLSREYRTIKSFERCREYNDVAMRAVLHDDAVPIEEEVIITPDRRTHVHSIFYALNDFKLSKAACGDAAKGSKPYSFVKKRLSRKDPRFNQISVHSRAYGGSCANSCKTSAADNRKAHFNIKVDEFSGTNAHADAGVEMTGHSLPQITYNDQMFICKSTTQNFPSITDSGIIPDLQSRAIADRTSTECNLKTQSVPMNGYNSSQQKGCAKRKASLALSAGDTASPTHHEQSQSPSPEMNIGLTLSANYQGLLNIGNSCYMNAVLQAVLRLPGFNILLRFSKDVLQIENCSLLSALANLSSNSQLSKDEKADLLKEIKRLVFTKESEANQQQDAHEFLICMLNAMKKEFDLLSNKKYKRSNGTNAITSHFVFKSQRTFQCSGCGKVRIVDEEDIAFPLPVRSLKTDVCSLESLLNDSMANEHVQHTCRKCKSAIATMKYRFCHLPRYFVCFIKRYHSDSSQIGLYDKCHERIALSQYISLHEDSNDEGISEDCSCDIALGASKMKEKQHTALKKYELSAVVRHIGTSAESGHYVCNTKGRKRNVWLQFDDENVNEITLEKVIAECEYDGYIFFFNEMKQR